MRAKRMIAMLLSSAMIAMALPVVALAEGEENIQGEVSAQVEATVTEQPVEQEQPVQQEQPTEPEQPTQPEQPSAPTTPEQSVTQPPAGSYTTQPDSNATEAVVTNKREDPKFTGDFQLKDITEGKDKAKEVKDSVVYYHVGTDGSSGKSTELQVTYTPKDSEDTNMGNYSYQWCTVGEDGKKTAIAGATGETYTLKKENITLTEDDNAEEADRNKKICVQLLYKDSATNNEVETGHYSDPISVERATKSKETLEKEKPTNIKCDDEADTVTFTGMQDVTYEYSLDKGKTWKKVTGMESASDGKQTGTFKVENKNYKVGDILIRAAATEIDVNSSDIAYKAGEAQENKKEFTYAALDELSSKDTISDAEFTLGFAPSKTKDNIDLTEAGAELTAEAIKVDEEEINEEKALENAVDADEVTEVSEMPEFTSAQAKTSSNTLSVTSSNGNVKVSVGTILTITTNKGTTGTTTTTTTTSWNNNNNTETKQYLLAAIGSSYSTLYDVEATNGTAAVYNYYPGTKAVVKTNATVKLSEVTDYIVYKDVVYGVGFEVETNSQKTYFLYDENNKAAGYYYTGKNKGIVINSGSEPKNLTALSDTTAALLADGDLYQVTPLFGEDIMVQNDDGEEIEGVGGTLTIDVADSKIVDAAIEKDTELIGLHQIDDTYEKFTVKPGSEKKKLSLTAEAEVESFSPFTMYAVTAKTYNAPTTVVSGTYSTSNNTATNGNTTANGTNRTTTNSVNTGDEGNIALWAGIMLAAAAALVVLAIVRRRMR